MVHYCSRNVYHQPSTSTGRRTFLQ